jgi:hypothetical protein
VTPGAPRGLTAAGGARTPRRATSSRSAAGQPADGPHQVAGPGQPRPRQRAAQPPREAGADQPQRGAAPLDHADPRSPGAGDVDDLQRAVAPAHVVAAQPVEHRPRRDRIGHRPAPGRGDGGSAWASAAVSASAAAIATADGPPR